MPSHDEHILVAAVLNARSVILNIGEGQGVEVGDKFEILASEKVAVQDPSTGELIAHVPVAKTTVKVTEVLGASACKAQTFRVIKGRKAFSHFSGETEDRIDSFEYEQDETTDEFRILKSMPISKGDLARPIP